MRRGLFVIGLIAAFFFSLGLIAWVYAAAEQKTPDLLKIDENSSFFKDGKRTKPGVPFSHQKHEKEYNIACTQCHHVYKDGQNTWKQGDKVQKCSGCHQAVEEGKKLTLQLAFHKNCRDCHAKLKNEGKKTGPTLCAQCHVAEKN
jgi:hypothetical protein